MLNSFFACKKSEDSPAPASNVINWKEELKNTTWAGEYKYTSGSHQSLQPFSTKLNADGTLTWTDLENTRPAGTWKVEGSQLNFTFPNSTTLSATLGKEQWSDFKSGVGAGFVIDNAFRSMQPGAFTLLNTTWKGTHLLDVLIIKFLGDNTVIFSKNGENYYDKGTYSMSSAGLQFNWGGPGELAQFSFFGIFKNDRTAMTCAYHYRHTIFDIDEDVHWTAIKQ